jgi:Na+/H+ antiporter NhaD/arsenite permease-like protein
MEALKNFYESRSIVDHTTNVAIFILVILVSVLYFSVAQIKPESTTDDKQKQIIKDAQNSFVGIWSMLIILFVLVVVKFVPYLSKFKFVTLPTKV